MASRSTRSRMRLRRPFSVTTSTLQERASCSSISKPPRSKRLRPGSSSTRKSISLLASASPRATEPKIRTFLAPYFAAMRMTSVRLRFIKSAKSIFTISNDSHTGNLKATLSGTRTSFILGPYQGLPALLAQPVPRSATCAHFQSAPPADGGRDHPFAQAAQIHGFFSFFIISSATFLPDSIMPPNIGPILGVWRIAATAIPAT